MLLTRFWIVVLSLAAGAGLAASMLAQRVLQRRSDEAAIQALRRDRVDVELWLRLEARTRMDAIAPLAADRKVREALRRVSAERALSDERRKELEDHLRRMDTQLKELRSDLLVVLDRRGRIVVQLGGTPPPPEASLGGFPFVRRVLQGYLRDDTWLYGETVYRVVARPIIDQGRYVGALLHAKAIGPMLAQRLGERLGGQTTLAFVRGNRVLAAYVPSVEGAPGTAELQAALASGALRAEEGSDASPISVGDSILAYYRPVVGSAAYAAVGYVLARPRSHLEAPWAILQQASRADVEALPWPLLAGGALGLLVLGMLFAYLEHDRPQRRLLALAQALKEQQTPQLPPSELPGKLRKAAEAISEVLDQLSAKAKGAAAGPDLEKVLGPPPAEAGSSYFGFATPEEEPPTRPVGPPPAPAAPPPERSSGPPAVDGAPPKPPAAPAASAAAAAPPAAPASTPSAAPSAPDLQEERDEGATMVAAIPEELLRASMDGIDEDEEHFREVFQQFLETKRKCGEPTAGIRYERFRETLLRNRDQIRKRHGVRKVRFRVYVKEGRAAIKATPIKE